ncbi:uncharacterized protein JN550_006958 [Neoarthrinium moseri]|uniref:uncharacterized protein n=1 Tax=Neoarthrinium moseri TaxID=1658444 RepID=UPI001FDC49A1|nr:uncharacterized protein JN550_006958 [Neoarthrinium moseri]KAI1867817.1 hypothetical protein JN550_006958 [Neoarthrinium moseri]
MDKESLKANLNKAVNANKAWLDENSRLNGVIEDLRGENARLERSVSVEDGQIEGFKRRIHDLKKELRQIVKVNDDAIHSLEEKLFKANDSAGQWKRKFEDLKVSYDGARRLLGDRDARLERSDAIIDEQRANIHRLRDLLARYRGW